MEFPPAAFEFPGFGVIEFFTEVFHRSAVKRNAVGVFDDFAEFLADFAAAVEVVEDAACGLVRRDDVDLQKEDQLRDLFGFIFSR